MKPAKDIYAEIDQMAVSVQKDPFALGPNYINEGIADCHRHIEKISAYIREIGAAQFLIKKDIMLLKRAKKLQTDEQKLEQIDAKLEEKQLELLENSYLDSACRIRLQNLKSSLTSLKFQWDMVSVSLGSNIADTEKKLQRRITPKDFLEEGEDELANLDIDAPRSDKKIPAQSIEEMLKDLN